MYINKGNDCSVEGCDRDAHCKGWCKMHYERQKRGADMRPASMKTQVPVGEWYVIKQSGYVMRTQDGKQVFQHREVMKEKLGRDLLPHETVHHINGVRSDNRPENLELWTKSQPAGQRVEDKIAWAKEFLAQYGEESA